MSDIPSGPPRTTPGGTGIRFRPMFEGDRQTGWSVYAIAGFDHHVGTVGMLGADERHRLAVPMVEAWERANPCP